MHAHFCEANGVPLRRLRYCHEVASQNCANASVIRISGERVRCAYDAARKKCRLAARRAVSSSSVLPPVVLMHVPKTAGTSLRIELIHSGLASEMEKREPSQHKNASLAAESCFSDLYRGAGRAMHVTLLRNPRDHVLSQFYECRDSRWFKLVAPAFPRNESFERWVMRFATLGARKTTGCGVHGDYGCYNPINLATRQFTCRRRRGCPPFREGESAHHLSKEDVLGSVGSAITNMELLEVAGLTELFAESWCLIEYRMRGRLSSGCACEDAAEEAPRHAFIRHDVATHSVAALSSRLLAAIDAITALDQVLYRAAVVRFLRDVRDVESRAGVRILCEARLELLRRTTRYIPGLWTSSETKFTR